MKLFLLISLVLFNSAVFSVSEPLSADSLLDEVLLRLPGDPIVISGNMIVRKRRGVVVKELQFEMGLSWGKVPSEAKYTLFDGLGTELERLVITRSADGQPSYAYFKGDPATPGDLPDLFSPIQKSDVSWMDISLSFLWWRGGKILGEEKIKDRLCNIVEVHAPDGKNTGYSKAKLWIDKELSMLLQAEGYGPDGDVKRKLWIRSFKKIDDRWMVKDMEIQSYPIVHRTKLRVNEVDSEE